MVVSIVLSLCVLAGGLIRIFYGWLSSHEPFAPRKFFSTLIAVIFIGLIPQIIGILGADVVLNESGLMLWIFNALLAGWGIDELLKQLKKG